MRILSRLVSLFLVAFLSMSVGMAQVTLKSIQKKGKLVLGTTGSQPPYSMTSVSGDPMGFEIELAQALANAMNVELEIKTMKFDELLKAVEAGEVDAAMSGITMTIERNLKTVFIGPYSVTGKTLLTKKSVIDRINNQELTDIQDLKISALKGSTSESLLKTDLPEAQATYVTAYKDGVDNVINGTSDAMLSDYPICVISALRYEDKGLECLPEPITMEPIGMALNSNDPHLINLIQNYFSYLELSGQLEMLTYKWFDDSSWLLKAKLD